MREIKTIENKNIVICYDYSYISSNNYSVLIQRGIAKLSVYSIHIDKYFSEEEKEKNRSLAESISEKEWCKHCDESWKKYDKVAKDIMDVLDKKYEIYQYNNMRNYGNHELFFCSNRGWNNKDYMTTVTISPNTRRDNIAFCDKVINDIVDCYTGDVPLEIRVQYELEIIDEGLRNIVIPFIEGITDKFITYRSELGKIKKVNNKDYGFFRKGAKRRYYELSHSDLCNIFIKESA